MRRGTTAGLLGGLLFGMATLGLAGGGPAADDDLAVVKKAVAPAPTPDPKESPARPASTTGDRTAKTRTTEPQWLKVRIVESGAHKSRVTVNLPLAMVRALGDDFPVDVGSTHLRLSEVLRTLESGEPLVEVKSPDSTVRVWVE